MAGQLNFNADAEFLVVAPQGLGDSLEATPIVSLLKRALPLAKIDVVVTRDGPRQLFSGLPDLVRDVLYLPYWDKGKAAFATALLGYVGKHRYDASFLAYPAARREYHLLTRMFRAKRRYVHRYESTSLRDLLWLHTDLVDVGNYHTMLRNVDLVRASGVEISGEIGYVVPSSWRVTARHPDRIAVHPGTIAHDGLEAKRWPEDHFRELAEQLIAEGFSVYLVSGPAERDVVARMLTVVPAAYVCEGALPNVARFLSSCAAVVSNDSGIAHLAAAVGTPTMAIHGPTSILGGPFGPNAVPFRPSACPPCFDVRRLNTECALKLGHACLKRDIPVDLVYRRLLDLMHEFNPLSTR